MTKRLLIGTLLLTIFVVSLIPAIAHAYRQDDYELTKVVGGGTVSNDAGFSAKIRATFLLRATDLTDGTIEGVGKVQLAIQGFSGDFFGVRARIFELVQAMTITWSFNRGTKSLTVSGRIGGVDVLHLSGTVVGNTEVGLRQSVELTGWVIDAMTRIELVARVSPEADDMRP